jgi:hypothetical protein
LDGTTQYGGFPYNNKVLVINKALSTAGAGLLSSKSQIRKGTAINFSVSLGHSLKYSSLWQVNNISYKVFVEAKDGVKWYLFEDGKWYLFNTLLGLGSSLRLQRGNFKYYVDSNSSPTQQDNTLAGINAVNTQNLVLLASYDSQPCPVDGYLQILIEPFFNPQYSGDSQKGDLFQFHPPVVSIISLPKGIDEVTYESTITGKHTVIAPEQEVYFCDNSLDLIPCSVYDVNGVETSQYTLDTIMAEHMLLIPLLEKQVQFSRSFLKIRLNECYSHNLRIGDVFKFDATGFSDMSGAEFVVISKFGHDYRTAKMGIIAGEIVESASNITYDIFIYNEGIKESIRRNIPYSTTPTSTALEPPWFWVDIPSNYFTFSITGIDENSSNGGVSRAYFNLNATSGVINWGDGSSSALVNGVNQHNYATTGPRYISVSNIVGGTSLTFGGSNNVTAFNVSLYTGLTQLFCQANKLIGSIPSFASNTAIQYIYLDNNQLTGTIPSFSANTALIRLILNVNQLTGGFPEIPASGVLTTINLNTNQLSGTIPSLSASTGLTTLDLSANQFTGSIPSFASNTALQLLYVNQNQFTGFSGGFGLNVANNNYYHFGSNLLTQGAVDAVLAAYKTISTLGSGDTLLINGSGNPTPSATGLTDKGIIQATGATCTTN